MSVKRDTTMGHTDQLIRVLLGDLDLMEIDQNGDILLLADTFENIHHLRGTLWVQTGNGLVCQQQGGVLR